MVRVIGCVVLALGCALCWVMGARTGSGQQLPAPVQHSTPANTALQRALQTLAAEPAVERAHWGISVVRMDGTVAAAVNAGQFFQPASNTKLFTTAAAMALLPINTRLETRVVATGQFAAGGVYQGDLMLVGGADANFSGRPIPYRAAPAGQAEPPRDELRYVQELADRIKAAGITRVEGNIVGDDRMFPYDPIPQDWAVDDLPWYYGAPVTPLMIADNALTLTVTAGAANTPATAVLDPALPFYTLDVQVRTGTKTDLQVKRSAGSRTIEVRGSILAGAKPYVQAISIANPAEYAAAALKFALEAGGIVVTGQATAKEEPLFEPDFDRTASTPLAELSPSRPLSTGGGMPGCAVSAPGPIASEGCSLAVHRGEPLYEDVVVTNKVSQNQHAEIFLRLLGLSQTGTGTTAQGARVVRAFLTGRAGLDGDDFIFVDGSGLSGHDLVTPRATTTLLRYAARQPWGQQWKASLPVGGIDGSLRSRFATTLKGRVFAKTGTLGEARALSGYLIGDSGRTVVFSVMVTGHTPLNTADQAVMDRMVAAIAAAE